MYFTPIKRAVDIIEVPKFSLRKKKHLFNFNPVITVQ